MRATSSSRVSERIIDAASVRLRATVFIFSDVWGNKKKRKWSAWQKDFGKEKEKIKPIDTCTSYPAHTSFERAWLRHDRMRAPRTQRKIPLNTFIYGGDWLHRISLSLSLPQRKKEDLIDVHQRAKQNNNHQRVTTTRRKKQAAGMNSSSSSSRVIFLHASRVFLSLFCLVCTTARHIDGWSFVWPFGSLLQLTESLSLSSFCFLIFRDVVWLAFFFLFLIWVGLRSLAARQSCVGGLTGVK